MGNFLHPGRLGSDNFPAGKVFPEARPGFFFPSAEGSRDFYFYVHCDNLVEIPETKVTKMWGLCYGWVLLDFLTVRCIYTGTP